MESIPENPLLKFHPDTLQAIRKLYDLDQPGRMSEAIDILDSWVKKQEHFLKKDFDKGYLERTIISTKGLVERAKKQLDKRCTMKTLLPLFFEISNAKNDFQDVFKVVINVCLPKLTSDNYRVSLVRTDAKGIKTVLFNFYRFVIMMAEYLKTYDYNNGIIYILDYRNANVVEMVSSINLTETRQLMAMLVDAYGYRIKSFHIIHTSKTIEALIAIFKQAFPAKLGDRIMVHSTVEAIYEHVEKDILPVEYGGSEKSIKELHNDWVDALSSKEYIEYMKVMYKAGTDETLRPADVFNDQYLGMPGTFRTLKVD